MKGTHAVEVVAHDAVGVEIEVGIRLSAELQPRFRAALLGALAILAIFAPLFVFRSRYFCGAFVFTALTGLGR